VDVSAGSKYCETDFRHSQALLYETGKYKLISSVYPLNVISVGGIVWTELNISDFAG
jgi:hypothetical protein